MKLKKQKNGKKRDDNTKYKENDSHVTHANEDDVIVFKANRKPTSRTAVEMSHEQISHPIQRTTINNSKQNANVEQLISMMNTPLKSIEEEENSLMRDSLTFSQTKELPNAVFEDEDHLVDSLEFDAEDMIRRIKAITHDDGVYGQFIDTDHNEFAADKTIEQQHEESQVDNQNYYEDEDYSHHVKRSERVIHHESMRSSAPYLNLEKMNQIPFQSHQDETVVHVDGKNGISKIPKPFKVKSSGIPKLKSSSNSMNLVGLIDMDSLPPPKDEIINDIQPIPVPYSPYESNYQPYSTKPQPQPDVNQIEVNEQLQRDLLKRQYEEKIRNTLPNFRKENIPENRNLMENDVKVIAKAVDNRVEMNIFMSDSPQSNPDTRKKMRMLVCTECSKYQKGGKFCKRCGAPLLYDVEDQDIIQTTNPVSSGGSSSSHYHRSTEAGPSIESNKIIPELPISKHPKKVVQEKQQQQQQPSNQPSSGRDHQLIVSSDRRNGKPENNEIFEEVLKYSVASPVSQKKVNPIESYEDRDDRRDRLGNKPIPVPNPNHRKEVIKREDISPRYQSPPQSVGQNPSVHPISKQLPPLPSLQNNPKGISKPDQMKKPNEIPLQHHPNSKVKMGPNNHIRTSQQEELLLLAEIESLNQKQLQKQNDIIKVVVGGGEGSPLKKNVKGRVQPASQLDKVVPLLIMPEDVKPSKDGGGGGRLEDPLKKEKLAFGPGARDIKPNRSVSRPRQHVIVTPSIEASPSSSAQPNGNNKPNRVDNKKQVSIRNKSDPSTGSSNKPSDLIVPLRNNLMGKEDPPAVPQDEGNGIPDISNGYLLGYKKKKEGQESSKNRSNSRNRGRKVSGVEDDQSTSATPSTVVRSVVSGIKSEMDPRVIVMSRKPTQGITQPEHNHKPSSQGTAYPLRPAQRSTKYEESSLPALVSARHLLPQNEPYAHPLRNQSRRIHSRGSTMSAPSKLRRNDENSNSEKDTDYGSQGEDEPFSEEYLQQFQRNAYVNNGHQAEPIFYKQSNKKGQSLYRDEQDWENLHDVPMEDEKFDIKLPHINIKRPS